MTGRAYPELPGLAEDGQLYHNGSLDRVEALIPNEFSSVHAADLLELPDGDLLCCWFAGSNEGNADISIAGARLPFGETVWQSMGILSDDPGRSEQNPSFFLTPQGELWLMYTAQAARTAQSDPRFNLQYTAEIRRRISRDGGRTWGKSETMFSQPGSFCRQKIQVLQSGRWLFGNWRCFPDETRNGSDITLVWRSDDQGKTWSSTEVPDSIGRVHANLAEQQDGSLVMLLRSRWADRIYLSRSEDHGDSWSAPVPTELPNNNASISAILLKSGTLAVAYNEVSFNDKPGRTVWPEQRCPVSVALSDDGGRTFPYRRIVEQGEGFTGRYNDCNNRRYEYPVIMQGRDGSIHIAYSFASRRCIKYVRVTEEWIRGKQSCPGAENNPALYRRK